jgi:hypothetical protein
MFFWQFPSPGTPLFLMDEGPVAVLLKQARGGGMVLAGALQQCDMQQRCTLAGKQSKNKHKPIRPLHARHSSVMCSSVDCSAVHTGKTLGIGGYPKHANHSLRL